MDNDLDKRMEGSPINYADLDKRMEGSPVNYGKESREYLRKLSSESEHETPIPSNIVLEEREQVQLGALLKFAKSSKEMEMEMRLQKLSLSLRDFNRVRATLERLGFQQMGDSTKLLDIFVHKGDRLTRDNLSNLRFTLSNEQIPNYCQAGTFPLSEATLIYKGQPKWFESAFYTLSGLNEEQARYNYGIEAKNLWRANLDLSNYNIRIGTKLEIPFDAGRRLFYLRTKNAPAELRDALAQANNTFSDFLSTYGNNPNFRTIYKTFRLKQRVSYQHPIFGDRFRFDLTVVKSSMEDKPFTDFIDARLVERPKKYEIECELNTHAISLDELNMFITTHMTEVLKSVQNHHMLTPVRVAGDIMANYKRDIRYFMLTRTDVVLDAINMVKGLMEAEADPVRQARVLKQIEDGQSSGYIKQLLYSGKTQDDLSRLVKEVENRRNNIERGFREWSRNTTYFIVPKVRSMELTHLDILSPQSINREDMSVTDKADGITAILYINNDIGFGIEVGKAGIYHGMAVLIDSNLRIMNLNIRVPNRAGTIIVGEYVVEKGLFMAFDAYTTVDMSAGIIADISGRDLRTRLSRLADIMVDLNKEQSPVKLLTKEFLFADDTRNIYDCANEIWTKYQNGAFPYHLDGMIYTPNTPVGFNPTDYLYPLAPSKTWDMNLKWKPEEENTIDFYIVFEKDVVVVYKGRESTINRRATKPHNREPTANREYIVAKAFNGERVDNINQPKVFMPATPEIEGRELVYCPIGPKGLPVSEDGDVIEDKTIIECRFDKRVNMWFPMRTRYDKTLELVTSLEQQASSWRTINDALGAVNMIKNPSNMYESTKFILKQFRTIVNKYRIPDLQISREMNDIQFFTAIKEHYDAIRAYFSSAEMLGLVQRWGNDIGVANNIWKTIHYPVTETMICKGEGIPDMDMVMDKYYNRDPTVDRKLSLTYGLQNFHNAIVKGDFILRRCANLISREPTDRIRLLDLGTGKGGDLNKWKKASIHEVVGMDLFPSNINDPVDGAVRRYAALLEKHAGEVNPVVNFLVGDMTKDIISGAGIASESKELQAKLWRTPYDELAGAGGYETRKFNMITAMFCLHYAFSSKTAVKALVKNIKENLTDGGVFAGCCFDGASIYKALEGLEVGGELIGRKSGVVIWRLTKGYRDFADGLPDTDKSIGLPINVYVSAIGQTMTEYLVNFEYFRGEMERAGLIMEEDMSVMFKTIRGEVVSNITDMLKEGYGDKTKKITKEFRKAFKLELSGESDEQLKAQLGAEGYEEYKRVVMSNRDTLMYLDKDERRFSDFNRVFVFKKRGKTGKPTAVIRKTRASPVKEPVKEPVTEPVKEVRIIPKRKIKKDDILADVADDVSVRAPQQFAAIAPPVGLYDIVPPKVEPPKDEPPKVEPPKDEPIEPIMEPAKEEPAKEEPAKEALSPEQAIEKISKVMIYLKKNDSNEPGSEKYVSPTIRPEKFTKRLEIIKTVLRSIKETKSQDKTGIIRDKYNRLREYYDEMKSRK